MASSAILSEKNSLQHFPKYIRPLTFLWKIFFVFISKPNYFEPIDQLRQETDWKIHYTPSYLNNMQKNSKPLFREDSFSSESLVHFVLIQILPSHDTRWLKLGPGDPIFSTWNSHTIFSTSIFLILKRSNFRLRFWYLEEILKNGEIDIFE